MNQNIFHPQRSPIQLLEKGALKEQKERNKILIEEKGKQEQTIKQVAEIARQYWRLKKSLNWINDKYSLPENHFNHLKTAQINLEFALSKLDVKLLETKPGLYTEGTGKYFEAITGLPSAEVEAPTVDQLISPAVFQLDRLILKGEVQILIPIKPKN